MANGRRGYAAFSNLEYPSGCSFIVAIYGIFVKYDSSYPLARENLPDFAASPGPINISWQPKSMQTSPQTKASMIELGLHSPAVASWAVALPLPPCST